MSKTFASTSNEKYALVLCGSSWSGSPAIAAIRACVIPRASRSALTLSASHADVPALLAEALDLLAACDDDLGVAAGHLGVAPSRLVKVLRLEPAALSELNRRLVDAGRRPWR